LHIGTYFGTREEYAALNFEQRLAKNARNVVSISNDSWLSLVANWAETKALKLIGGLVCGLLAVHIGINIDFYSRTRSTPKV
jgi:hypothetical protein